MSVGVRPQKYRLDPSAGLWLPEQAQVIANIDEMLQQLHDDLLLVDNAVGAGTLAVSGGGTGVTSFTPYAVILGGTSAQGALQDVGDVGSSGQILTSNGAAAKPSWQAASTPARSGPTFATTLKWAQAFIGDADNHVAVGWPSAWTSNNNTFVSDTAGEWSRLDSTGTNGLSHCRNSVLEGPQFQHLPTCYFKVRTGSVISSACTLWAGLFSSITDATAVGTSGTGVLTARHAAFRFCAGTDTQWVGSVSDGTTQTVSANVAAIAASTVYTLKIRFITSTQVGFSVDGGTEVTVNLATNNAATNITVQGVYVLNVTLGNTRSIAFTSAYVEWT